MSEEIKNIFDDVVELKKANAWLASFALTDSEIKEIIKLISRIILGSVKLADFLPELKKAVRKDEETVKKIALAAVLSRFMPLKDQISGVEELLNGLGGSAEIDSKEPQIKQPVQPNTHISFSPEDDEEIKKIISSSASKPKAHDYSSLAELIISQSGYSINGDEVILSRFKNIIMARLKDIRDEMETLEVLKKSRKVGGLAMTEDEAGKVIALIREKISQGLLPKEGETSSEKKPINFPVKKPFVPAKTTLEAKKNGSIIKEPAPAVSEPKVAEKRLVKPDLSLAPKIEEEDGLPVIKSPQGDDLMIRPKITDFNQIRKVQPINVPEKIKIVPPVPVAPTPLVLPAAIKPLETKVPIAPQPQPMAKSTLSPRNIRFGKPSVDGVRINTTLVGPVEELGTMTLINFRRLGQTPHEATAKIKDKIELLEKDSYIKKLEAVEAWHKNEINRFYRLLGQESMRQGRSIDDIINERIESHKPTLSIEEFNSIGEINKDLRY
ncbi:MAG: hypothetical protein Q7K65_00295 [Candidatus Buchananbacteria bacterium]|nr:hypothetical protein [Candidatus Buchananbacteria bacterium]